jgi:hypothetical protein
VRKYVIATVEHFAAIGTDVAADRKSLDGLQAIHEVDVDDTTFDTDPDCHVYSHEDCIGLIDGADAEGTWWQPL